ADLRKHLRQSKLFERGVGDRLPSNGPAFALGHGIDVNLFPVGFLCAIRAKAITVFPLPVGADSVPKYREAMMLTASTWNGFNAPVKVKSIPSTLFFLFSSRFG
ncbi:MAG: hypothetical protein JRI22_07000, partial [Deltaproteobacteria bacterium]|nr:hypothetical protein [Deltaproteobacteria bacterium]